MYKVFQKSGDNEQLVYSCDNEKEAINVAIRHTEIGKTVFVSDSFQDVVYETFMMNEWNKIFT